MTEERRSETPALVAMGALLLFSLSCRALSTFVRYFNHDEFQVFYSAWWKSTGAVPGRDFYLPSYHLLVAMLEPLFRLFPDSLAPLFLARAANALGGALILWLVYRIAMALSGSRPASLLAVILVTFHTIFTSRIDDVRADTLNTICVLFAVLCVLRGSGRRPAVLAGLALGVAFVSRFKMAVAVPPILLLGVLLHGKSWVRRGVELVISSGIPVLLYLGYIALFDNWTYFWETQRHVARVVSSSLIPFSPFPELAKALRRNRVGSALVLVGLPIALSGLRSKVEEKHRAACFAVFALAYFVLYLIADPVFYPYNFVDTLPVLALLVPAASAVLPEGWRSRLAAPAALVAFAVALEGAGKAVETATRSNALQLRYLDYIRRAIRPDEIVFDLQGTHLFRRGPYHWRLANIQMNLYRTRKWFSVPEELRRYRVSAIVPNYRTEWLPKKERDFIAQHYVRGEAFILFPGRRFDAASPETSFEVLVPGEYKFRPGRPDGATLDGAPAADRVTLSAGEHRLVLPKPPSRPFDLVYTTPEREANHLEVKPGEQFLYPFD